MHATKLGFSVLLGLSPVCLSATASAEADFMGQKYVYQDALSRYSWHTDCVAYTVTVNLGRSELHNIGELPWSSDTVYVEYNAQDRCAGPGIRITFGTATLEQPVDLDPNFEQSTVDVDADIAGYDCTETDISFECTEHTFSFVATVTWTGVGPATHGSGKYKDPKNGVLLSSSEQDARAAEASVAGLVDGQVVDYTTLDARFLRLEQKVLYVSKP